jgi:large subunit ribosomal protein L31e
MAKKQEEPKAVLEREYTIPLRKEFLKVPEYKRTNKAVKAIREFLVKHMKIYDRDLDKIKIDKHLNNEIRFRGIRKPPVKIKVKAKKFEDGIVRAELAEIPKILQYKLDKERKEKEKAEKAKPKKTEKKEEKQEESEEKKEEKEEKQEAVKEAGLKAAEQQAHQAKHTQSKQQTPVHRKALQK